MENLVKKNDFEAQFQQFRGRLLPYAYNILGDSMEAEDVVQDILNNYFLGQKDHIQTPYNYLIRAVINRAINEKKKQKVRLAEYPGHWLPIPVSTEEGVYKYVDRNKILYYSLLVLLERLTPKERAVFILKESFDFSHNDVAEMLDVTIENSRQLYKRAKQKLEPDIRQSFAIDNSSDSILHQLTESILQADIEKVKQLLSDDVKLVSDGGPKTSAARNVISGKEDAYKLLKAIYGKYFPEGSSISFTTFNHRPAILYKKDDVIYRCILFEILDGLVCRMFIIVNPDKLQFIK
jgi:RNA polymerase sigma-70 factor (ECF subfamily)